MDFTFVPAVSGATLMGSSSSTHFKHICITAHLCKLSADVFTNGPIISAVIRAQLSNLTEVVGFDYDETNSNGTNIPIERIDAGNH